ncbi:hypothetical protein PR202_gb27403 [Eleusine coracana subsp. coracana]|uniref:C2 domain-containing protein n=1 Tax=Eleusine coracana subsp. coracana TaxID=191504 RepID=A0AAV5FUM9_ELECO|nr:hypothetical protein PR202_gb27403 [Eleusine coracana subsp. coracana]
MAHRELELTLLSARDLKSVNLFTRMDVYAVASISGDPMTRQCTPTDTSGGRNPSWNATLRFSVPPSAAAAAAGGNGWLHVLLRSERALGDRDIGEVVVPLAELLDGADGTGPQPPRLASYQVHTVHRGEPRGVLNVSYRLGPIVAPVAERDDDDKPQHVIAYPAPQQPFKPQNPAPPQQPYQYQNHKPQNPAPTQQPYQYQNPYKPQNPASQQQPFFKPQNLASQQQPFFKHQNSASQQPYQYQNPEPPKQPYQYQQNPPRDTYAPAQPMKPQNPGAPQQQQQPYYQYHDDAYAKSQPLKPQIPGAPQQQPYYQYDDDAYAQSQPLKPQNPAQPYHHSPRDAYTPPPPPRHEEANGYGPTNYYMGPHTQIILGGGGTATAPPPATPRSNTIPAKADDGSKPKPSYTPAQPNTSPAKTDHSWPKAVSQKHHDTPTWTNASPKKPDGPTRSQQHDTKVAEPAHTQPIITSQGKTDQSWPKASPQHHQDTPAWPNATTKKPADSSSTRPQQQHDIKVVEHVHTLTKVSSPKPDHPTRPQALEQQKSTQVSNISARKTNDTQVGGDYARTQSNSQPGKADSTRPKEAYANTRSNSTPGKVDHHQQGPKPVLQHDKVHSLPTATAR